MGGMMTEALEHINAEFAALLDAPTIRALCREVSSHGAPVCSIRSPPPIFSSCKSRMRTPHAATYPIW
jgi:hypothetical protein